MKIQSEEMSEAFETKSWEPVRRAFCDTYADLLTWDADTRKKWTKNVLRGLISIDNDYPREEREKIRALWEKWVDLYIVEH